MGKRFSVTTKVLGDIFAYFNDATNEKGGALLINTETNCLSHFVPLENISENPKGEYIFSFEELNAKISSFEEDNIDFIGIIHSHRYSSKPSKEDIEFFNNLLKENDYDYLLFPILSYKTTPATIKWWMLIKETMEEIVVETIDI